MNTYRMTITNKDSCDKIVLVTGENFCDAVAKVKTEYGEDWNVKNSELIFAQ